MPSLPSECAGWTARCLLPLPPLLPSPLLPFVVAVWPPAPPASPSSASTSSTAGRTSQTGSRSPAASPWAPWAWTPAMHLTDDIDAKYLVVCFICLRICSDLCKIWDVPLFSLDTQKGAKVAALPYSQIIAQSLAFSTTWAICAADLFFLELLRRSMPGSTSPGISGCGLYPSSCCLARLTA